MLDDPSIFDAETADTRRAGETFMKHITCIDDLRTLHQRRVPKAFFDYCDRGSYAEETLRANREDMQEIKFRQRILVDVSKRDIATTILGEPSTMPLIARARRACSACSTPTARSTPAAPRRPPASRSRSRRCRSARSRTSPPMSTKPFWFQLYVMRDRGFIKALIERAIAAKCSRAGADGRPADDRPAPQGHQERPDGAAGRSLSNLIDLATKPAWVPGVLGGKRRTFGNIVGHVKGVERYHLALAGGRPSSSTPR